MKKMQLRDLVLMAILAAGSLVLRMFDFPIFPPAAFLKFDFSDLLALIGMLIAGPKGLLAVALIRDILNFILKGGEAGIPIGAIMSLVASLAMFLPTHFLMKKGSWQRPMSFYIAAGVALTLSLSISLSLLNYFVALPWYTTVLGMEIDNYLIYTLSFILPFNLIKGIILSVCQGLVIQVMVPQLSRLDTLYDDYQGMELLVKPSLGLSR